MGNGKVTLAYVHPGHVDATFAESMMRLLAADAEREHSRIIGGHGGGWVAVGSGPRIASARNDAVAAFLAIETKPEWLLMVDTDMVFAPHHLDMLLDAADGTSRPIVGGLCFGGGRSGRMFPTLYRLSGDPAEPVQIIEDYPKDALVKVDATGAAFLLMHRAALKRIGDTAGRPYPWFVEGSVYHGVPFGEDWAFCLRANALSIPVHVHTGVTIGHVKPQILDETAYEQYRLRRDALGGDEGVMAAYRGQLTAEPAGV